MSDPPQTLEPDPILTALENLTQEYTRLKAIESAAQEMIDYGHDAVRRDYAIDDIKELLQ